MVVRSVEEMEGKQVYELWVKAWNEDLSVLDEMVHPECVVHQARTDGKSSEEARGPAALKGMIADAGAFFSDVKMTVTTGPIEEKGYISARWQFNGVYNGKMPGAKAETGKIVRFHGMDMFWLEEGRIREYWVSSDGIDLMKQLQLF
ncbi:ester cyclase [Salibacterium aidingense]|uniref:ester cyclase n=1 Tax=Salibacterium aidingense TaxID=384933 RepID=UPI003BE72E8F